VDVVIARRYQWMRAELLPTDYSNPADCKTRNCHPIKRNSRRAAWIGDTQAVLEVDLLKAMVSSRLKSTGITLSTPGSPPAELERTEAANEEKFLHKETWRAAWFNGMNGPWL
jgi:hypothetical protein